VPAAARLTLAGFALLAALLLPGCGAGSEAADTATVTGRSATTAAAELPRRRDKPKPRSAAGPCQSRLGGFVASMDSLRRRLAVGVTFDQYLAEVRGIGSTYRQIRIGQLQFYCLDAVGTPGEKAFNRYIEAANDWGDCVSEAGCTSAAVEPKLQRRWRIASHFLAEATGGLRAGAP
jgi:hypothetical protein